MDCVSSVLPNGIHLKLMKGPRGVCSIGAVFPIGSINSPKTADTQVTLSSKLVESLISPKHVFMHQVYPFLQVNREYSYLTLQFLPESTTYAIESLKRFLDGAAPANTTFDQQRQLNYAAEQLGEYNLLEKYKDLVCMSSFSNKSYAHGNYALQGEKIDLNPQILKEIPKCTTLVGSIDMYEELVKLGGSLSPFPKVKLHITSNFEPNHVNKNVKQSSLQGSKISMTSSLSIMSLSWPSCEAKSVEAPAYAVLSKIFGGGSEFSSEGLGSGFSSLLYTKVVGGVARCHQAYAYNNFFTTGGRFNINVVAEDRNLVKAAQLVRECIHSVETIEDKNLDAARGLVITAGTKELNASDKRFNEFVRSSYLGCKPIYSSQYKKSIKEVTRKAVEKALKQTFSYKPAVAVYGPADPNEIAKVFE